MEKARSRKRKRVGSTSQAGDREATRNGLKERKTDMEHGVQWRKITAENLDLDYCILLARDEGERLLKTCEQEITYNTGRVAQVRLFGKWIDIPRKQAAFGDAGLSYTFSGNTVPAQPWLPFLGQLRDRLASLTGHAFNFVLVNRYCNGNDYMGEHKDDEKDLDGNAPIASLSLGQPRDFYFKHQDCRGAAVRAWAGAGGGRGGNKQSKTQNQTKDKKKPKSLIETCSSETEGKKDKVMLVLEPGSLLMMNPPTNNYWYHALPKRKNVLGTRINLTFRCMKIRR